MNKIYSFMLCFLAVAAAWSCKKETDRSIRIEFSSDKQEVFAGETVVFSDQSTGPVSRWKWTFEGGEPGTSELSSPEVVYAVPGTYAVTLEVSNADHSETLVKETFIQVGYNELNVDFSADNTTVLQGETIQFTDLTTGLATAWRWEFIPQTGNPIVSEEQNPSITFSEYGVYTVKLSASNPEYSGEAEKENFITIVDPTSVTADFNSAQTATYAGGNIQFNDQSLGTATSWVWTFEGGTPSASSDQNPTVSYSAPGRYTVKLVASNSARSSEKEVGGYILVAPSEQLVGFFPFNSNYNNVAATNLSVSLTGTLTYTEADRKAVAGKTATFNGASVVTLPNDVFSFGTDDYSVACWIKTNSTARMMVWQESGKNGSGDNQSWLRIGDNTTDRRLRFNTENPGSAILNLGAEGFVADGNWHHVVCVRQGVTTRVYIDGVRTKEMSSAAVKNVTGPGQLFKIGAQEGTSDFSNFFTGQLDDVMMYKKALSDTEILTLFNL